MGYTVKKAMVLVLDIKTRNRSREPLKNCKLFFYDEIFYEVNFNK